MKSKTMKKALALFLAVLMIALALPLTALPTMAEETTGTTATAIKNAKVFAKNSDGWDMHVSFGSVAGMIDGDPYDEFIDKNGNGEYDKDDGDVEGNFKRSSRPYYESDTVTGAYTDLYVDSVGETRTYYGYAVFELNGTSSLDDMTIWLTANAYNESQTVNWRNPANTWGINDGYEILVSTDGETWTFVEAFTEMCGDGTNKGANFPSEGDPAYATSKTADGYDRVGHKIALNGIEAKYVAIAVTAPSTGNCIDIGEVTVNGTVVASDADEKTPAQIYEDANEGDRLQIINFNDMSWSDDYMNSDWWNTYVIVSEDGRSAKQLIHSKKTFDANNMRAMWGGIAEEARFSLNGEKYTIYFDVDFGRTSGIAAGIQVYDDETLLLDSNGKCYRTSWNTEKVTSDVKWSEKTDKTTLTDLHSFAIEVDSAANTMTLYVADSDGKYNLVYSFAYGDISGSLKSAIFVKRTSGTVNDDYWVEVSYIDIFKGLVATSGVDRAAEYDNAKDGDLLYTADFGSHMWSKDFASDSNCGADVEISKDGSSVNLVILNKSSKRAMWGGLKSAYQYPLTQDENGNYRKYTVTFNVDFGSQDGGKTLVGIQVDGYKTITLDGNGNCKLWHLNDELSDSDAEKYPTEQWDYAGLWRSKGATHTFALEIDPENGAMTLYIMDLDGVFYEVLKYEDVDLGSVLSCRVYTRSYTTGSDVWTRVSNIQIYKGFPISTEEDRAAEYENAKEGDLLTTLNFADRFNWHQGFVDKNNNGAEAVISEDGSSARLTLLEGVSNDLAMWGGLDTGYPLREVLNPEEVKAGADPIHKNNNYTVVFDLEFGSTVYYNYGLGIMVDGNNVIVIDGFGCNYMYELNTEKVKKSDAGNDKWNYHTDVAKAEKHTFAVEVDPAANTLTLYVANADGSFEKVRAMTYDGAKLGTSLNCRIQIRKLDSEKTSDANSWTEVSDVKIYKGLVAGWTQNVGGASVRIDKPTGIRFTSEFRRSFIDSLRATYGEKNVNLGMIITPTDYLTNNGVEFEMAALDACTAITGAKYVKINATAIHSDDPEFYTVNCALVNVKEGNYNREFSARAFIEVNGEIYMYADYDEEYNSRSIACVAEAAYGDVEAEADEDYKYPVVIGGNTFYSPYSDAGRNIIAGFFNKDLVDKSATTISVMSYNLEYKRSNDANEVWEGRDPATAVKTIIDANPDIVDLQEDTEDWNDYLAVLESKGYANLAGDRKYNKYKFGNGWAFNDIYYKTDKFNLLDSGWKSFKNIAKTYTIEGYEGTNMSIDNQGDAEGWFSDEDIGRTFSYAVTDDMNAHVSSTNGKRVLNGFADSELSFARDEAIVTGDTAGTLASSSNYTRRDSEVFDHIIYRNVTAVEYTVINNLVDEYVNGGGETVMRYPSDHLPVYATFICN